MPFPAAQTEAERRMIRRMTITQNEGVNEGVNDLQNGAADIFAAIRRNPGIRSPSLVKIAGRSQASVERAVSDLKRLGKIEFRGAPKTGGYYCKFCNKT